MLQSLLSCYHGVVQDFHLSHHSVEQCLAYDKDPWKGPIGKDGVTPCTPSANAAGGGNGAGNACDAMATHSFN